MAFTYSKLAEVTLASSAATIDFTNVPQNYNDLIVKLSVRSTAATDFLSLAISLNGSSTGFTSRIVQGDGSSAISASLTTYSGAHGGTSTTASTFSNVEIYIPNYTSASNKSYSIDSVVENNATATRTTLAAGLWSNTTAIALIGFGPGSGSFAQHSTATLYGVKAEV